MCQLIRRHITDERRNNRKSVTKRNEISCSVSEDVSTATLVETTAPSHLTHNTHPQNLYYFLLPLKLRKKINKVLKKCSGVWKVERVFERIGYARNAKIALNFGKALKSFMQ